LASHLRHLTVDDGSTAWLWVIDQPGSQMTEWGAMSRTASPPLVVALSGGVDSAVAAARAAEAGFALTAVHLALSTPTSPAGYERAEQARTDAERVAAHLGLPFLVWDFRAEFAASVVAGFEAEYARGRTPNPCLTCNRTIKFGAVLDRALGLGFGGVVTGHYAIRVDRGGVAELHRGADPAKDQSYVLAVLGQDRLRHAYFPLGPSLKSAVRREAADRGLPVANRPDSSDICFIAEGNAATYLRERLGIAPGVIVDGDGTVVGGHDGTYGFTIGQRRGLRLGRPAGDGAPRYVVGLDPVTRTVTVGPHEALRVGRLWARDPIWMDEPPAGGFTGDVQVRAHAVPQPCHAAVESDRVRVDFDAPAYGIAPGQTAVLYDGTRVVGAMTIDSTGG